MKIFKMYIFALLASNLLGVIILGKFDIFWFMGSFIGATITLLFELIFKRCI